MVYKQLAKRLQAQRACLLCQQAVTHVQQPYIQLCRACHADLPLILNPCAVCSIELPAYADFGSLCAQCQQTTPKFSHCIAVLHYEPPISHLIGHFKESASAAIGRNLSRLLANEVLSRSNPAQRPQLLVPMPLHRKRLCQRGFNQSLEIAKVLQRSLGIKINNGLLKRVHFHGEQKQLDAQARKRNIKGAFFCPNKSNLSVEHIALIDDVVTSTATANEAAHCLLKANACKRVDVWCLARTDKCN